MNYLYYGNVLMEIVIAQEKHIPEIIDLWMEFSEFHASLDQPWYPLKPKMVKKRKGHFIGISSFADELLSRSSVLSCLKGRLIFVS